MEDFDTAIALTPTGDGSYLWVVPEGWRVGHGAWGGLVIGSLVSAIERSEVDRSRVVRSVSAEIASPAVVGPHRVEVTLSRRGSGLSTWMATTANGNGELVARLTAVVAEPRKAAADIDCTAWGIDAPHVPAREEATAVEMVGAGPEFVAHLQISPVSGIPYSSGTSRTRGFVRLNQPTRHSAASLLALVDGWWPGMIVPFDRFHPVATVNFSANLLVDPESVPADEWLLHDGFVSGAHDGFVSEQRRLWSADGRLVVDNLQSMVLIK